MNKLKINQYLNVLPEINWFDIIVQENVFAVEKKNELNKWVYAEID